MTFLKSKKLFLNLGYTISNIDNSDTIFKIEFDEKLFKDFNLTILRHAKCFIMQNWSPSLLVIKYIKKTTMDK